MLDLGWQELFLISLVAIIVVGPKAVSYTHLTLPTN